MSKPSDGALRAANAAERAMNAAGWDWINAKDHLAEIIDRETDLPDLLAALKRCLGLLEEGPVADAARGYELVYARQGARDAIAKAEKEGTP